MAIKCRRHNITSREVPDFIQIWIFSTDFSESPQYLISWKTVQWEPRRYMQTDGNKERQTDVMNFISDFRDYTNCFSSGLRDEPFRL